MTEEEEDVLRYKVAVTRVKQLNPKHQQLFLNLRKLVQSTQYGYLNLSQAQIAAINVSWEVGYNRSRTRCDRKATSIEPRLSIYYNEIRPNYLK